LTDLLLILFFNVRFVENGEPLQRATLKKQLEVTRNQKEKLETLCRTLQTERKQQKLALSNSTSSVSESSADAVTPPLKVENKCGF
jgi:hypothetical protein